MEWRYWVYLVGILSLIVLLMFLFMHAHASSRQVHPVNIKTINNINTTNTNSNNIFAQKWRNEYLGCRPSMCLNFLPTFHGEFWNNTPASKFNNCYAYAFRNMDLNRNHKPQPGELSNVQEVPKNNYTCDRIFANVVSDHPGTMKWEVNKPCPCGYFKGFLVLSQNPPDYHFLREDSNGFWSHKLGGGAATQYDAQGQLITNPFSANLNYGQYNYSNRCFAFCTPYEKQDTQW